MRTTDQIALIRNSGFRFLAFWGVSQHRGQVLLFSTFKARQNRVLLLNFIESAILLSKVVLLNLGWNQSEIYVLVQSDSTPITSYRGFVFWSAHRDQVRNSLARLHWVRLFWLWAQLPSLPLTNLISFNFIFNNCWALTTASCRGVSSSPPPFRHLGLPMSDTFSCVSQMRRIKSLLITLKFSWKCK